MVCSIYDEVNVKKKGGSMLSEKDLFYMMLISNSITNLKCRKLFCNLDKLIEIFISFPTLTHLYKSDIRLRSYNQYTIRIPASHQ